LAKLFGVSEGFWTNLQVCCELHSVRRKEQEILEKIKPTKVQPAGE
jgi:plasmid maintenance system antidote protein VapI